ncbi:MAG: hypothetical protein ACXADY_01310 [Candidatus Hodarchaeales archaeon]
MSFPQKTEEEEREKGEGGKIFFEFEKIKQSEDALREIKERLRRFMNSTTDSFSVWDLELNLADINTVAT